MPHGVPVKIGYLGGLIYKDKHNLGGADSI